MDNFVLMKKSEEIEKLSTMLGFEKTFFLDTNFVILSTLNKKELLLKIQDAKKKKLKVIYEATAEDMLRFVIEKAPVDIVMGAEKIYSNDSLHFVRSGLDQVLCTMAGEQEKIIAFSFHDILTAANRPRLLARMSANVKLCHKYKVKTLFSTFAQDADELRSAQDLAAWLRILQQ